MKIMKPLMLSLLLCLGLLPMPLATYSRPASVICDEILRKEVDAFGDVMGEHFGIHHLLSGLGNMIDVPKILWCLAFTSSKCLTLEEARPLALHMADSLWQFATCNPLFVRYIETNNQDNAMFSILQREPLTRKYFGFRLAFWDSAVNRPLSPYLAQVTLAGNDLLYYYADPVTQALLPPIRESLDEARQSLVD